MNFMIMIMIINIIIVMVIKSPLSSSPAALPEYLQHRCSNFYSYHFSLQINTHIWKILPRRFL